MRGLLPSTGLGCRAEQEERYAASAAPLEPRPVRQALDFLAGICLRSREVPVMVWGGWLHGRGRLNDKRNRFLSLCWRFQLNTKRAIQVLAVALTLAVMVGCQASGNQSTSPENAQAGAASGPGTLNTSVTHQRQASRVPAAPRAVTVPAGTSVHVRLSTELNTGSTAPGSAFDGTLTEPVVVNGVTVAPRGSLVGGRVTNVVSSGRLKRPAEISLMLTSITPNGGERTSVSTQTWSVSGQSHKKRDITMIGGGAGVGAAIGAIAGGGKGAAIGSAIGAAGGTAGAYATGKKEIDLPAETGITFRLTAPARFSVQ